jgi:hypothetical protein
VAEAHAACTEGARRNGRLTRATTRGAGGDSSRSLRERAGREFMRRSCLTRHPPLLICAGPVAAAPRRGIVCVTPSGVAIPF